MKTIKIFNYHFIVEEYIYYQSYININLKSNKIYPLNLSILISGGKETNKDSHSTCEGRGKSPTIKSRTVFE